MIKIKEVKLNIIGMHCKSCEMLIADVLEDVGCKNVSVSHKTGILTCEYDEENTSVEEIKKEIKKEGYDSNE